MKKYQKYFSLKKHTLENILEILVGHHVFSIITYPIIQHCDEKEKLKICYLFSEKAHPRNTLEKLVGCCHIFSFAMYPPICDHYPPWDILQGKT